MYVMYLHVYVSMLRHLKLRMIVAFRFSRNGLRLRTPEALF